MVRDDDEAWRAIVDNYGDRAQLDAEDDVPGQTELTERPDPEQPDSQPDTQPEPSGEPVVEPERPERPEVPPELREPRRSWDDDYVDSDWNSERFVPPPPPPLPRTTLDRYLAWVGVFGAPAALLTFLLLGVSLPLPIGYLLVASFVAGFLYLVVRMPRGPRDPYDDGAQV